MIRSGLRCGLHACVVATVVVVVLGCGSPEPQRILVYKPKPNAAPPLRYCCDATGHQPHARPFIFGGTCCCTPTPRLMEQYHRDGLLKDYTTGRLMSAYAERGIMTDHGHRGCNNACRWGPHVIRGGHCMATPTPGTANYEEVLSGQFDPPALAKEKPSEQ